MIIKTELGVIDLEQATHTELIDLLATIQADITDINEQISQARRIYRETGEKSDPDWFRSAHWARTHKRKHVQAIQLELAKRKESRRAQTLTTRQRASERTQKRKAERAAQVEYQFVEAARTLLPQETFNEILAIAIRNTQGETQC